MHTVGICSTLWELVALDMKLLHTGENSLTRGVIQSHTDVGTCHTSSLTSFGTRTENHSDGCTHV